MSPLGALQIFPVSGAFPIPLDIVLLQVVFAGLVTFVFVLVIGPKTERYPTYDLLNIPTMKRMAGSRVFHFSAQLLLVAMFVFVLFAGFLGAQTLGNISVVLVWAYWYVLLFLLGIFLSRVWCFICPWKAITDWTLRRSFWKVKKNTLGLNRPLPMKLRSLLIPVLLFFVLITVDISFAYGWEFVPFATSLLGVGYLYLAFFESYAYGGGSFCKYHCIVGWIQGCLANFSPIELRVKDKDVCAKCRSKDCLRGNDKGYGCPTYQVLQFTDNSSECLFCMECVKTCPNDNVAVNLRPIGMDLATSKRLGMNGAYFAVIFVAVALFHRLGMSPSLGALAGLLELPSIPGSGYAFAYAGGSIIAISLTLLGHYVFSWLSKELSGNKEVTLRSVFSNYAYSLLPFAFLYIAGHSLEHLFSIGQQIIPAVSDPFGWGWNLFGTAAIRPLPILSTIQLKWLIVLLVVISVVFGVWIAYERARILYGDVRQAVRSLIPMVVWILVLASIGVWFVAQPMVWVPFPT